MNKRGISILLVLIILGTLIPNNYADAYSLENYYISVKLSRPIKQNNSINLYSENGFSLYYKDDLFREIQYFDTDYINISLNGDRFTISDSNNYYLFEYEEYEDIVIGSTDKYDSKIKVEDSNYRGYIYFKTNGNEIIVINYLNLDEYLYGIIPKEMSPSFNMEALKAQAIAARTFALNNINKHSGEGYDLCDTSHCQVYGGMDVEYKNTNRAVDETSGLVITYNGDIINSVYHSNSGGYTEDSEEVWGGYEPYLIGVEDRYSIGLPNSYWSFDMNREEVENVLRNSGIYIGEVLDMEIIESSPNGRVLKLKIIGTIGEEVLIKSQIRQVFGYNNLKSTWFTITREGDSNSKEIYAIDGDCSFPRTIDIDSSYIIDSDAKIGLLRGKEKNIIDKYQISKIESYNNSHTGDFTIQGKGNGHGVGMSQYGANGMANEGYAFEEILKHYYSGVEITRIY